MMPIQMDSSTARAARCSGVDWPAMAVAVAAEEVAGYGWVAEVVAVRAAVAVAATLIGVIGGSGRGGGSGSGGDIGVIGGSGRGGGSGGGGHRIHARGGVLEKQSCV